MPARAWTRSAGRKERSVIVRELEAVLAFDALELDVRQPRLELIETFLQTTAASAPRRTP